MYNFIKLLILILGIGVYPIIAITLNSQINDKNCIVEIQRNKDTKEFYNRCFLFVERMTIIISGSIVLASATFVVAEEMGQRRKAEQERKKKKSELRKYELVLETYKKIIEQPVSKEKKDYTSGTIRSEETINYESVQTISKNLDLAEDIKTIMGPDNNNTNENSGRPAVVIGCSNTYSVNPDNKSISDKIDNLSKRIDKIESNIRKTKSGRNRLKGKHP